MESREQKALEQVKKRLIEQVKADMEKYNPYRYSYKDGIVRKEK